jgi:hypothetical protein
LYYSLFLYYQDKIQKISTIKNWFQCYLLSERGILYLTPKALQGPNFGHCYFGQVLVIRRCDMIFWEFYGK